jgi:thiol-disulfide isomerase/thioredoxin
MKQTTALEVIEDMEEGKKIFVVFKSPYCHYCQALEPVLEYLQRINKDLDMRYIDTQTDDSSVFEDYVDGVPSIALVSEGKFSILEEPAEPHQTTWYTTEYLAEAIKNF